MKPGTETEEEYVASNNLLLKYLDSDTTVSLYGAHIVKTTILLLRCHLFTPESHFSFMKEDILVIFMSTQTVFMRVLITESNIGDVIQSQI